MIAEFIDGLQHFHFLQNALITAIVIGVVAGAVGCFIILRGMSLMGDAISHAVLPGVALSFILGIDFFIGAIIFGLMAPSSLPTSRVTLSSRVTLPLVLPFHLS